MTPKEKFDIVIGCANILILCITAYFIHRSIYSPVDAVKVGRKLNQQQAKDNAKLNLFRLLFSLRGNPLHYDFVRSLNEIDIVFEDSPDVLSAWHVHANSLQTVDPDLAGNTWLLQRTNLLSAMALSLGYKTVQQTDMIAHYYPVGHENQVKRDWDLQASRKRHYDISSEMALRIIDRMKAQDEGGDVPEIPAP